ncbi:MAG: hypothetical protein D6765_08305 [Bacteroidetes bacterium]|nr:MAG: hypothetical protein D6765_08305 [Bacteroidota bacterium]
MDQKVSLHYEGQTLRSALADITERYGVPFSYSSYFIPVEQPVRLHVEEVPLRQALELLFAPTPIEFSQVGNQIVLRLNPDKPVTPLQPGISGNGRQSTRELNLPAPEPPPRDSFFERPIEEPETEWVELEPLPPSPLESETPFYPADQALFGMHEWETRLQTITRPENGRRPVQLSLVPLVGTNARNAPEVVNNLSVNVLWGVNGGVSGLEFGGLVNSVQGDVRGFQFAGLGNTVQRNMTGTQVGGFFNYTEGRASGIQLAGLGNMVQADVNGVQAAGVFNLARGDVWAVQASSVVNFSGGAAKMQISGLVNSARRVEVGQIGLLNVAGEVRGFQFGLVNVSDTVSGVPIGLFNIVKRGYKRFEFFGGEALHFNLLYKMGAERFYNIFYVGARYPVEGRYTWAFGYGIGTLVHQTPKAGFSFDALALHISENEPFTNELNFLGQVRVLYDRTLAPRAVFFLGPTLNLLLTQRRNPETGEVESGIVPYSFLEERVGEVTRLHGWLGLSTGFRF